MKLLSSLVLFLSLLPATVFAQGAFEGEQSGVTRAPLGIYGGNVGDLVITPNGTLYAAVLSPNGVFCSTDGGQSWSGPPAGSDFGDVGGVAAGADDATVYVLGGLKLYRSTDTCATFQQLPGSGETEYAFDVLFHNGKLLVGGRDGSVDISADNGQTFTNHVIDADGTSVLRLAGSPTADVFFALVQQPNQQYELFTSVDGGVSWNTTGKIGAYSEVAVDPADANIVVLAGSALYEISTNGGGAFNDVTPGGASGPVKISFITPPAQQRRIFIGTRYTTNQGGAWNDINAEVTSSDTTLTGGFIQDPNEPNTFYGTSFRGVAKSTDSLANWDDVVQGMIGVDINDIAQAADKNIVYFAATAGLARTTNYLSESPTWTYPIDVSGIGSNALAVYFPDPENASVVIASSEHRIYRSTDGGNSWNEQHFLGVTKNVVSFTSTENGTLYAGFNDDQNENGGVLTSTDQGVSWTDTNVPNSPFVNVVLGVGSSVFAGVGMEFNNTATNRGIYRLASGNWTQVTDGDIAGKRINDLVASGTFVVASAGDATTGGIFRSADNGDTWESASTGIDETRCMEALALDPDALGTLYASSGCPSGKARIFKSTNGGDSWTLLYEALTDEVPGVMLFDELLVGFNTGAFEFDEAGTLTSPAYGLWNGFLNFTNILEVVNKGASASNVTVTLYGSGGAQLATLSFQLAAQSQFDVILNDLTGFEANNYGSVKVEFTGSVDARVSFYRAVDATSPDAGDFEIAYSLPLQNALTGNTHVGFNTFQPSLAAGEGSWLVTNWLTILNQDSVARTFTVRTFKSDGTLQGTNQVTLPALGRVDLDGGHSLGQNMNGYHAIEPQTGTAPYQAYLMRYGTQSASGVSQHYSWSVPIRAASSSTNFWVRISSAAGETNWIELTNPGGSAALVTLNFYNHWGVTPTSETLTIEPGEQAHVHANSYLPVGTPGAAEIVVTSGSALAESISYFHDQNGSVATVYASGARVPSASEELSTGWNLFLDQVNWLRIFNTATTETAVTVRVLNNGSPKTVNVTLPARTGTDLPLHDTATYGTAVNAYGIVGVTGANLLTETVRMRTENGAMDFFFTLPAR